MRITLDIPGPVYRQLRSKAALRGSSVKELTLHCVQAEVNGDIHKPASARVAPPLINSKRPGWLKLNNKTINEILLPSGMTTLRSAATALPQRAQRKHVV